MDMEGKTLIGCALWARASSCVDVELGRGMFLMRDTVAGCPKVCGVFDPLGRSDGRAQMGLPPRCAHFRTFLMILR